MKQKGNKNILPRETDKHNRVMSLKDEYNDVTVKGKKDSKTNDKK